MIAEKLLLKREQGTKRGVLVILEEAGANLQNPGETLPAEDLHILSKLKNPRKAGEFILGRTAARKALELYFGGEIPTDLSLQRGVFGQPVIKCPRLDTPEISLAHTNGAAAAVVFQAGQQLGVDLELLKERPGRLEAIQSSLISGELQGMVALGLKRVEALYTLWTVRESLAKVLKTGITIPLELLAVRDPKRNHNGTQCEYVNFPQYKSLTFSGGKGYICSITLPLYTELEKE